MYTFRQGSFQLSGQVGYGTTVAAHVAMCKEAVLVADLMEVNLTAIQCVYVRMKQQKTICDHFLQRDSTVQKKN